MFSLELRNSLPPPPGLSLSIPDATRMFSSLSFEDFSKVDEDFFKLKEKHSDCPRCSELVKVSDKMFIHKQKAISCLIETFNIIQKETISRIKAEKELEELKNEKLYNDELSGPYKKIRALLAEAKKKDKNLTELISENRELKQIRITFEKMASQLQKELSSKSEALKTIEERKCENCAVKETEIKSKEKIVKELQESVVILNLKIENVLRIAAEKDILGQKLFEIADLVNLIPEVNGRELRMNIHKKYCEIETDFIELPVNSQSFEIIKEKYLQLPYLLKPIFDLTKQFEKCFAEQKKILYNS